MRSLTRLTTALLVAAVYLPAQDAGEILRQTAETYRNLKNYHFELVTDTETAGELSQVRLKLIQPLAAEDPGRMRAEIRQPGIWRVAISDGRTGWQCDPAFREFARKEGLDLESAGPGRPDLDDPALRYLRGMLQDHLGRVDKLLKSAEILREEPLEIDGARPLCWVIQAEYEPEDRLALSKQDSRMYWIDKVRKLVLREERRSRGSVIGSEDYEDQERSSTTVFRLARINTSLPDALFTFDPPPDAVEVGTLPEPGRRRDSLRGQPAPDFSLRTLSGAELKLSSLRGQVVLLDFWSTSCGARRAQMPE